MENSIPINPAVAIPTFIGSLLSAIATVLAILMHIVDPPKRHFRHALIMNLLIADCINSINNTVSGGVNIGNGRTGGPKTPTTPACVANAWVGQFTVQTVDTTILIISFTVLSMVLRTNKPARQPTLTASILICVAAWIPGLITSMVGLGLGIYGHVSGNWCWIKPQYLGLRYGLTHGWRIFVFVATIVVYTIIYIRLKKTFKHIRNLNTSSAATSTGSRARKSLAIETDGGPVHPGPYTELEDVPSRSSSEGLPGTTAHAWSTNKDPEANNAIPPRLSVAGNNNNKTATLQASPSPNLKRMLLMNGYPIAYIILWIPGMANRLAESILGKSPVWLQALQASTQFVGLVNALTYGVNEQVRRKAKERWQRRKNAARTGG